jgi:hypothetical protein
MLRRIGVLILLAILLPTRGGMVGHAHEIDGDASRWTQHIHLSPLFDASGRDENPFASLAHGHSHPRHGHSHSHTLNAGAVPLDAHHDDMIVEIFVDDALSEDTRISFDASSDAFSGLMSLITLPCRDVDAAGGASTRRGHPPPDAPLGRSSLHILYLVLVI